MSELHGVVESAVFAIARMSHPPSFESRSVMALFRFYVIGNLISNLIELSVCVRSAVLFVDLSAHVWQEGSISVS